MARLGNCIVFLLFVFSQDNCAIVCVDIPLGAVHMSRAIPANRADSILSRPMVAQMLRRTKIKGHGCLKQHESLPSS